MNKYTLDGSGVGVVGGGGFGMSATIGPVGSNVGSIRSACSRFGLGAWTELRLTTVPRG